MFNNGELRVTNSNAATMRLLGCFSHPEKRRTQEKLSDLDYDQTGNQAQEGSRCGLTLWARFVIGVVFVLVYGVHRCKDASPSPSAFFA